MSSHRSAGLRLSPIVVASVTMLAVLVMAITQVLPGGSHRADSTGVALVMVAAVLFVLITLTVVFVGWLSRDERGENGAGQGTGPLLFTVPAMLIVLVLAISQVLPGMANAFNPTGAALTMVALVLFVLIASTVAFVRWLSADERGAFD